MSDNTTQRDVLQRIVFPDGNDTSIWDLYVDWGHAPSSAAFSANNEAALPVREVHAPPREFTRHSLTVPAGERLSLATYFNAFPASYWQHWTNVEEVTLTVVVRGDAVIDVIRSSARGTFTRIDGASGQGEFTFTIPLNRYGDGGWVWFELEALGAPAELVQADWSVPVETPSQTLATVAITTFNMPDDCIAQAKRFLAEPAALERVSEIVIVDQGNKHVVEAEGYAEVQQLLGDKLRVIEQPNLGGSGGFSRGMYEMLQNPNADYVLLLDDDAVIEPEGLLRAIAFDDHALVPTIVGGHMLNLHERTILHSFGEKINLYTFWWESVDKDLSLIDLGQRTIRNYPPLNRRIDVDYNGWWMCLIPRQVVETIGLSLPFFIKWDDAEYGLRAAEHDFPTVSLPGAAVWHVPWTEKDDGLDWQAYFHQRNRWVTALLHSPYPKGGAFPRKSLATDTKHLLSLQYFAERLRLAGLSDVEAGPAHLHATIGIRAAQARQLAKNYDDARLIKEVEDYPRVHRTRLPRKGEEPRPPKSGVAFALSAVSGAVRQLRPMSVQAEHNPEAVVSNADAKWWRLSNLDSALVSNAEGSGVWFYRRDPDKFKSFAGQSVERHLRLRREWNQLSAEYKARLDEVCSVETWCRTFGIDDQR